MKYKRIGATGKGLTRNVLNAGGSRAEKFMGDAIRVGNKALPSGGSRAASTVSKVAGKASRILGGPIATGIGLALTPRTLGNSTLGKNAPKTPPNALEASLSSAPSKAVGKGTMPKKANFKKDSLPGRQVSTKLSQEVSGQMGPKNHSKLQPKMSSSSGRSMNMSNPAARISNATSPAPVTNYDRPAESSKKRGGFFKRLGAALTKAPTPRGPSEYEQIMRDIQPSRKKKR